MECLRAKVRRAQARYGRTAKGRMTLQRYRLTAKSQRVRFYETLRQVTARHARAHEELR